MVSTRSWSWTSPTRTFLDHESRPELLREVVEARQPARVLIDEVQRLPSLLNTVQSLVDSSKREGRALRFLLTGSSARKLRRGNANLLPGRISMFELGPLIDSEVPGGIDVKRALRLGTLPEPYLEESETSARRLLRSYAGTYLKEEIQAEALTRNLEGFSRFLFSAAEESGRFLDFSKLAKRAKVSRTSTVRFFEILEDTLIAHRVAPFHAAKTADLVKHARFFFFDTGVLNALLGAFETPADRMGFLFEHFLFSQMRVGAAAKEMECRIWGFRTRGGLEIDFVVECGDEVWAIEAKSGHVDEGAVEHVFARAKRYLPAKTQFVIATAGKDRRKLEHARVLPWNVLLREMGLGAR